MKRSVVIALAIGSVAALPAYLLLFPIHHHIILEMSSGSCPTYVGVLGNRVALCGHSSDSFDQWTASRDGRYTVEILDPTGVVSRWHCGVFSSLDKKPVHVISIAGTAADIQLRYEHRGSFGGRCTRL